MAQDKFGYDRTVTGPGTVMTGDFALLDLGGRVGLAQGVSITYSQNVQQIREVGDADVFLTTGDPVGQLSTNTWVSKAGFFTNLPQGTCGSVEQAVVSLGGKGNCATVNSQSAVHMSGIVAQSYGVQLQAGNQPISTSFQAMFMFMS